MNTYLVIVRGGMPGYKKLNEDGRKSFRDKWSAYIGELTQSRNWVKGHPLHETGRLVPKKKEAVQGVVGQDDMRINGFMVLEAQDYDAAVRLCDNCPSFEIGGNLEIREVTEL
jgi:hypothetical protein